MTTPLSSVRIVVADDHEVVRAGFAALLDTQPDFTVLGIASDGAQAVQMSRELRPDVILMDVRMPGTDGIEATRQLTAAAVGPRVIILTTFDLDEYVYDALRAGASGFLLKDVTAERLFDAVRVVAAGEAFAASNASIFGNQKSYHFVFVNHVTTNTFFTATKYGIADACALTGSS